MSDSPRHNRMATNQTSGQASISVVRPQPITEASLMESVAGFITEVQSFHHQSQSSDPKVHVTWAKFERTDINDAVFFSEHMEINGNYPPLLLVLGYTQGIQVWLIPASGEAQEVLSWKYGQYKSLKVLPTPENVYGFTDNFAHCRPLIVMVDSTGPGTPFSSATFTSLRTGEVVQNIKFNSEIADVSANRRLVVMAFKEKLAAFDACNLEARFTVTNCYPSPGVHVNPVALGDRWLAYADQRLVNIHRSMGGMEVDGNQSVTAWGINVGSKLAQGVSKIYSNIFSTSGSSHSSRSSHSSPSSASSISSQNEPQKGVVTILDTLRVYRQDRDEVMMGDKIDGVVAHFIAHNKAIVAMEFDSNGSLLLTCDRLGNYFNLFRIVPHPAGSCYASVHHLYSLYRGDTPGSVQDIAFSPDSRWVAVSTLRGTTHIFPITPYGGPVGVRTHTSSRVVNRLSRFHRSAGLDEHPPAGRTNSSGRSSPNPTLGSSPVFSKMSLDPISSLPLVIPFPNPHVPPFPTPTLVQPVAQLRQPYLVTLTNQTLGTAASGVGARKPKVSGSSSSTTPNLEDIPIRLAVTFAPSRAWLVGGSQNTVFHRQPRRMHDSLFVVANHGVLLEYILDPMPDSTLPKEKICESSPIELQVTAYGQWTMTPPREKSELQPPISVDNPLMSPLEHLARTASLNAAKKDASSLSLHDVASEDQWLSQVEIVTHIGPHRRLWMGPQFCFKTFRRAEGGRGDTEALDINLTMRPEQSTPVNMPAEYRQRHGSVPVLIEAGSASSFELSPHFANQMSHQYRGSREQVPNDVESELQEAMSDNVLGEESLLDGGSNIMTGHQASQSVNKITRKSSWRYPGSGPPSATHHVGPRGDSSSVEEEFFCLTPEDARSIASSGCRSRNASSTSVSSAKTFPVQMGGLPDTKIFSVAVEAKAGGEHHHINSDVMVISDVDTDFTGRFAVVSTAAKKSQQQQNQYQQQQKQQQKEQYLQQQQKEYQQLLLQQQAMHTSAEKKREQVVQLAVDKPEPKKVIVLESETPARSGNNKNGKGKGKKNRKGRSSEESADDSSSSNAAAISAKEVAKPQKECDSDFDFVPLKPAKREFDFGPLKTDDFCREISPKIEEEVFEMTSNNLKMQSESTEDLLADALLSVVDDEMQRCQVEPTERAISPTPSEEFKEMKSASKNIDEEPDVDDEEEHFFVRETKSSSPEPEEEDPIVFGTLLGGDTGNSIVKSIEFAAQLYGDVDDENDSAEIEESEKTTRLFNRSSQSNKKVEDSSEDDCEFKPVSRRQKRSKKKGDQEEDYEPGTPASNYADSESSLLDDQAPMCGPEKQEGWSFEADDLDISRLIAEVVIHQQKLQQEPSEVASAEEKTALDDIFKFDSELVATSHCDLEDDDCEDEKSSNIATTTTDESENDYQLATGPSKKIMSTSLNVGYDDAGTTSGSDLRGATSLTQSLNCAETTSAESSSVGNSPNPKKNKTKSKRKKRR